MMAIYASPIPHRRSSIWEELSMIEIMDPWLLIGGFNCMIKNGERGSEGGISSSCVSWTQENRLIDLGFIDPRFKWNHGNNVETRRSTRLDRRLCDDEWRRAFPVRHLPHSSSDHRPIMLQTKEGAFGSLGRRHFRFQAAWLAHNVTPQML